MALDLTLTVTADASQAKRELASVEQGIKKVEQAGKENTTSKVMQALTGETSKASAAQQKLTESTKKLADTSKMSKDELIAHTIALVKQDAAAINAAKSQGKVAESMAVSAAATKNLLTPTNLLIGAWGAAAVGLTALVAVIGQSVRFYLQHADAMEDNRRHIQSLHTSWEAFQFVVGQAAVGNNNIGRPVALINGLLIAMGLELSNRIGQFRQLLDIGARFLGVQEGLKGADPNRPTVFIDPAATARSAMEANKQYQRDMMEMERARIQLAEEEFQNRKKAAAELERSAGEMVKRVERESDARENLNQWMNANQKALKEMGLDAANQQLAVQMRLLDATTEQWFEFQQVLRGVGVPITNGMPGGAGDAASIDWLSDIQSRLNLGPKQGLLSSLFGGSGNFGQMLGGSILSSIHGGGNILGGLGSTIGSQLGGSLAGMLTGGAGIAIKGLGGGLINAILPGAGALLGPLLGKLGGWIGGLFGQDKGRSAVEDFGDKFGGLDKLHQILGEQLPNDAERLWVALTQSKGDAAIRAIDMVTQALQRQQQKHVDTAQSAVDAAQKEVDAQAKVIAEIEQRREASDRKIAALSQAIAQEAAEDEIGIIEKRQREELAMEQEHRSKIQAELDEANKRQEENLSRLTDAMDRLAEALKRLTANPWEININGVPGGGEAPEVPGENSFAGGTNGYRNFGSGQWVKLHGWEKVTPMGRESGPVVVEVPVYLDGKEIARSTEKHLTSSYRKRYSVGAN